MKKSILILFAMLMLVTVLPTEAFAQDVNGWSFLDSSATYDAITAKVETYINLLGVGSGKNSNVYWNTYLFSNDLMQATRDGRFSSTITYASCVGSKSQGTHSHNSDVGGKRGCTSNRMEGKGISGGISQCYGFADYMAYVVFGDLALKGSTFFNKYTSFDSDFAFFPGDVIRYPTSGGGHSRYIYKIVGETVYYIECNYGGNCLISYSSMSRTSLLNLNISSLYRPAISATESPTTLRVSFNANGGICFTNYATFQIGSYYGDLPTTYREGYNFSGWYTQINGGTIVESHTPVKAGDSDTLYARWTIKTYRISYDANGGTGAPSSQTKTYGANLTLSSTKPTRANSSAGSYTVTLNANGGSVNTTALSAALTTSYTFKNWNTAANGSGTNYNAEASYTSNASATLYAQWNSSTSTASVKLPTPTRTGYTFKGWSTSSTATSGITGSYTPTGNVTLYAAWEAITSIDSQNFPDEVFRNYVSENCDTDKDGYLSSTEIADVTVISVSGSAEKPGVITSLKGVEYFTELTELNCSYNQLTSLDLSKNTNLTYLACWNNRLTVLDVSNASALQALYCYNNQLTSLNLADNTALKYLICSDNKLASLILNCNVTLQEVNCINNQLTSISLINYTSLRYLYCQNNRLSLLDLHDDTALSGLFCSDNQLTELNVIGDSALRELNCTNNQLTTLNLNNVSALQWLYCANNQIYNLNIMDNPNLACLYCFGNQLPYLDISSCKVLQECVKTGTQSFEDDGSRHYKLLDGKELATDNGLKLTGGASVVAISESSFPDPVFRSYISENCDVDQDTLLSEMEIATTVNITCEKVGIKDLTGVEFFTSLKALICSGNELRELNLSNNPDLAFLRCNDNNLNNLDVSACHGLVELTCHNNQLTDLNTNGCNIMFLRCDNNQLTNLDVSAMTQLFSLNCTHNQLTSLDVSNNASLYYLYCPYNNLTAIDVSHNPYLCEFTCHSNQLTELDISQNPALQWLSCSANELTNLDVQLNTALKTLYCENNSLSELNVDNLTSLELLNCANNNINALNVSKNTELQRLWCYNNHLTKLDTTNNPKLILLSCLGNQLTQLDISKNTALRGVACYRNQISTLNIKDCPLLIELTERMEPVISDGIINYVYDTSNNDFLWLTYDESTKLYCTLAPDFTLPAALKEIDEEAFADCAFSYVHIPDGVTRIERRAFADCPNLHDVDIPESATSIDPTAFAGTSSLTIHGTDGSYAEFYAGKYGFAFIPVA